MNMDVDLRKISDQALMEKLSAAVREERRLTIQVLHLLCEVEARELFAKLGFSSLFSYCVEHLKYSESAAQRRIVAMRAIRNLPELEEKIESGKLSLSVVALAESALRQNAKNEKRKVEASEQRQVFREVEGLSRRRAEAVLVEKFELELPKPKAEQALSNGGVRIALEFSEDEMREIEELRRLSSRPTTTKEMILSMVRAEVGKKKRQLGEAPLLRKSKSAPGGSTSAGGSDAISAAVKREVWVRAHGQCEHQVLSGARCSSRHTLEFDHVLPRAHGGSDEPGNLRLLCVAHHRLVTTEMFGASRMQNFRPSLVRESR